MCVDILLKNVFLFYELYVCESACKVKMVDWATQDRLYPSGYQQIDIRYRRISIDSSLPYSVATNKSNSFFLLVQFYRSIFLLAKRFYIFFCSFMMK